MELLLRAVSEGRAPVDLVVDAAATHTVDELTVAIRDHLAPAWASEQGTGTALVVERTGARLDAASALGQVDLLTGDVVREPVRYADGCILALDGPGLGVEVDETALREWTRR